MAHGWRQRETTKDAVDIQSAPSTSYFNWSLLQKTINFSCLQNHLQVLFCSLNSQAVEKCVWLEERQKGAKTHLLNWLDSCSDAALQMLLLAPTTVLKLFVKATVQFALQTTTVVPKGCDIILF